MVYVQFQKCLLNPAYFLIYLIPAQWNCKPHLLNCALSHLKCCCQNHLLIAQKIRSLNPNYLYIIRLCVLPLSNTTCLYIYYYMVFIVTFSYYMHVIMIVQTLHLLLSCMFQKLIITLKNLFVVETFVLRVSVSNSSR